MGLQALLVEDDPFMRTMLVNVLRSRDVSVFATSNAADAAAVANLQPINVAVLDLHLGSGPTGIDVAMELRKNYPQLGIVFLTSFDDPRLLDSRLPALPENAQYLTKSSISSIDGLLIAMKQATLGLPSNFRRDLKNKLSNFTGVQLETLQLLAQGLSNSEIAKRRFVTERSVEISIARIAKALGLSADSTRNQRVHMAKVYFRAQGRSLIDGD